MAVYFMVALQPNPRAKVGHINILQAFPLVVCVCGHVLIYLVAIACCECCI